MSKIASIVPEVIEIVRERRLLNRVDFYEIIDDLVSSGRVTASQEELKMIKSEVGRQLHKNYPRRGTSVHKPAPKFLAQRFKLREATPEQAIICVDGYLVTFRRVQGRIRKVSREGRRLDDTDFRRAHAMAVEAILAAGRDANRADERRRVRNW